MCAYFRARLNILMNIYIKQNDKITLPEKSVGLEGSSRAYRNAKRTALEHKYLFSEVLKTPEPPYCARTEVHETFVRERESATIEHNVFNLKLDSHHDRQTLLRRD